MVEAHTGQVETGERRGIRHSARFILGGLSGGHGVFHWFTQSFLVMLPDVRDAFNLTAVQVGAISTTRQVASGVVSLPGGIVSDMLRRHWGLVLAGCMAVFGLGWLVMGLAPGYPIFLLGMAVVAVAASIWHLPAMAALSHHFAHRRGSALSLHGIGGNIGDVLGPVLTGFLLGVLTWQNILGIYAAVPLFLAFLVFWAFRDIGRMRDAAADRADLPAQMAETRRLLKDWRIWCITLVGALRSMAHVSLFTFLPLYLADVLHLSTGSRGIHIALLQLVGIGSTPFMGYLSDRLGRKVILVPGLVVLGILTLLLVPFGEGIPLIIILALLGTFLFSDQPILTAAALDLVGDRVATTTLGSLHFSRFALSAAAPLIAGTLYEANVHFIFYYVAGLFALAAVILLAVPLGQPRRGAAREPHGHHHH